MPHYAGTRQREQDLDPEIYAGEKLTAFVAVDVEKPSGRCFPQMALFPIMVHLPRSVLCPNSGLEISGETLQFIEVEGSV